MASQKSEQYEKILSFVNEHFYAEYLEALKESVRIPSLNPEYDPNWKENQALFRQQDHMISFVEGQNLQGVTIHKLRDEGKTPFIMVEVKPFGGCDSKHNVLMYGHLDKQPFGDGWKYPPSEATIEGSKLYGRGSSDDCYAFYSAVLAVKAVQENNGQHPRIIITIEGSEEGGDMEEELIYYMKKYKDLIGEPDVVICLDSDAFREDTLVISSSLRGCLIFDIVISAFQENLHSGYSGIMPDPYHVGMALISRIFDFKTQ